MKYFHLYDEEDNWLGQFGTPDAAVAHAESLGKDPNACRLELGASKYPPT
jgi:hypothetical protein